MGQNNDYIILDTIEQCNYYFGLGTSNPLVSIIDLSTITTKKHTSHLLNLYGVICNITPACCTNTTDLEHNSGYIKFFSPGYLGSHYVSHNNYVNGYLLIFHPDILEDTLLARRMNEYSFFDSPSGSTVWLSETERNIIINCIMSIREELSNEIDRYSKRIIVAGIAVLLSLSMRYSARQHKDKAISNNNIVARLNTLLNYYISLPSDDKELPSVARCAHELNISANYLGDIVRKQAGCTAKEYIDQFIISEVKLQLIRSTQTINQIAYNLGFKYPHHLTRLFKRLTGVTPLEFRNNADR